MTSQRRQTTALVLLGSFALGMFWMPKPESRSPLAKEKAIPTPAEEACPECVAKSADPNDCESGPVLFTAWVPAEQRQRLKNLDITFKDQEGRPGVLGDLVGQPLLITFFYTRCQNSSKCSAAVSRLAALQRKLAQIGIADKVRLLAITYEPQFDTPERINRFGLDRGVRFSANGLALQLDPEQHQRLVDELQTPVNYNAGWVNTHGVELCLIDAHGRLARKYQTMLWDNNQVANDIQRALKEP